MTVHLICEHAVRIQPGPDGSVFSTVVGLWGCGREGATVEECVSLTARAIEQVLTAENDRLRERRKHRPGATIFVYGHSTTGRLTNEGLAMLVAPDFNFRGLQAPDELSDRERATGESKMLPLAGPFVRWWVRFGGPPEPLVSRWVREVDVLEPIIRPVLGDLQA